MLYEYTYYVAQSVPVPTFDNTCFTRAAMTVIASYHVINIDQ